MQYREVCRIPALGPELESEPGRVPIVWPWARPSASVQLACRLAQENSEAGARPGSPLRYLTATAVVAILDFFL